MLINDGNCSRVIRRPLGRFAEYIDLMEKQLLNVKDVVTITTLSRATIYRYMDSDRFPKSIKLGPNRIAWKRTDVMDWVSQA